MSVRKPGYGSVDQGIDSELSMWYLGGNFIFGGIVGWLGVDPLTGAMWKLDPDEVHVDFRQR